MTGRVEDDALYLERTDQSLACQGEDVVGIVFRDRAVILTLSERGASSIGLDCVTRFSFDRHPELASIAAERLAAIAAVGHDRVEVR